MSVSLCDNHDPITHWVIEYSQVKQYKWQHNLTAVIPTISRIGIVNGRQLSKGDAVFDYDSLQACCGGGGVCRVEPSCLSHVKY